MRKRILGLVSVIMALCLFVTPAYAQEITDANLTAGTTTATVPVKAKILSSFTVSLPAELTLAKQDGSTNWTAGGDVKVKGDIVVGSSVTVSPSTSLTLTNSISSKTTTGTVSQTETVWTQTLLDSKASSGNFTYDGTEYYAVPLSIVVPSLTAGDWTGTITFTVEYKEN